MRDSYDDMDNPSRGSRRRGGDGKKSSLLILFLIIICLIVLVCFLILVPDPGSRNAGGSTVVADKNERNVTSNNSEEIVIVPPKPVEQITIIDEPETATVADPVLAAPLPASGPVVAPSSNAPSAVEISQAAKPQTNPNAVKFIDHIIQEGEDLNSIAELYGLKTETIISVNKIRNISGLALGDALRIPDRDGVLYTVQYGDMLSTIARKFNPGMGWQTLQELNGLKNENIKVGQELFIPDSTGTTKSESTKLTVVFAVPVKGTLIGSYLQKIDGLTLNGVYYTASAGSAITAAADGTVSDIGSDDSRGRFVVIDHPDGYRTTYAYLETVDTKLGKAVKKGDVIGSIGNANGRMKKPTLYFQLEQSGIALDPSLFF
jgi:Membrane-bound metallopeptidase